MPLSATKAAELNKAKSENRNFAVERQPYHIEVAANEIVQEAHVNTCITKIIRNVAAITFSKNCHVIKVEG